MQLKALIFFFSLSGMKKWLFFVCIWSIIVFAYQVLNLEMHFNFITLLKRGILKVIVSIN